MANTTIVIKKSATPSSQPTNLANGELAINYADGKLFYKNTSGYIVSFTAGGSSDSFATINANNTLIVADTSNDILTLEAGPNITITGDALNDKITIGTNALANTTGTFDGTLTVTGDLITRGNVTLGDASTDTITLNGSTISLGNNQTIDSGTLFIDAVNNRVGIGTTSLSTTVLANLEIKSSGASWYHNSITHGGLYAQFVSTGGPYFSIRTDNGSPQLRLQTSGNSIIMLPGSGNFGIGTTTPTSNLHVIGTANITSNAVFGGSIGVGISTPFSGKNVDPSIEIGTFNSTSNGNFIVRGYSAVGSIGRSGYGAVGSNYYLDQLGSLRRYRADSVSVLEFPSAGFSFKTAGNGSEGSLITLTELLRINSSGNVGIGASNPTSKLEVIGTANITSNLIVGTTNIVPAIEAAYNQANGVGIAANTYATAAAAGANAYMISVQNGSNTAVGTGANAFASATISGANTAVGAGANAFASATISGANTAVGTGANAFATAAAAGANAYMISVQNGSNTAVGTGANAYAAAISNTISIAAFNQANAAYDAANNAGGGGSNVSITTAQLKDLTTENTVVTSVASFTGTVVDSTIAIAAFNQANAAFEQANTGGGGGGTLTTFTSNVGDGSANTFNVSHQLNSYWLLTSVRELSTGDIVYPDMRQTTANNLVITFVDNPTANQYALLVAKVA